MSKRPFISQQSQTLKKKKLEEEGGVKEVISSNNEQKNKKIDFEALFADDDDAPKNRRLPPLSSKLGDLSALKSTLKKDTVDTMTDIPEEKAKNDEEDSLDAFMSDIAKVEEKVVPKVRRDDIEDEDDMETFFKHREKELKKQEEQLQLAPNFNENEEEYDSDDLASAAVKMRKNKKSIQPLPPIYHSEIDYPPFKKEFYKEHPEISSMTPQEVSDYRKELAIRVTGDTFVAPVKTFEQMNLGETIIKTIKKHGYTDPTPIQRQAIPIALSGRDLIGIAKTGSGKTAAFILPMLVHIADQPPIRKGDGPIGIVVAPTRELAHQIYIESKKFAKGFGIRICPIYGGVAKVDQVKELKQGCGALICTPGRLIDVIKMKKITNMKRATYLVLDEADRMFDMGFEPQVRSIAGQIRPDRQTLLFSATFKRSVEKVARDILTNPIRISIGVVGEANSDITQVIHVLKDESEKWPWLIENLPEFIDNGNIIIFVSTINACEELSTNLNKANFPTAALHGDKAQFDRSEILQKFKNQSLMILIATDVAARGLDIKSIKTVINFDCARDIDSHVHRVGRTGRAGSQDGVAHTLITPKNKQFAGPLIQNLEGANQYIPPALIELALQDPKFRSTWKEKKKPINNNDPNSRPSESKDKQDRKEINKEKEREYDELINKIEADEEIQNNLMKKGKGIGYSQTTTKQSTNAHPVDGGGTSFVMSKMAEFRSSFRSADVGGISGSWVASKSEKPQTSQSSQSSQPIHSSILPSPSSSSEAPLKTESLLNNNNLANRRSRSISRSSSRSSSSSSSSSSRSRSRSRSRDRSRRDRDRYRRSRSRSRSRDRSRRDRDRRSRSRSRSRGRDSRDRRDRDSYRRNRSKSYSRSRSRERRNLDRHYRRNERDRYK